MEQSSNVLHFSFPVSSFVSCPKYWSTPEILSVPSSEGLKDVTVSKTLNMTQNDYNVFLYLTLKYALHVEHGIESYLLKLKN